jgi:hypothetical protein
LTAQRSGGVQEPVRVMTFELRVILIEQIFTILSRA